MFEAFLVTTSSEGMQPLGSAAQRSFELVSGTVRERLGAAHAALFAEPVATEHGDMIDWYAPVKGTAVRLPDLSEEDAQAIRDRLGRLVADIRAEAETLAGSTDAQDQRLAEALSNAIEIPDEGMVYAVRDDGGALHPVLVHWAWLRDERQSVRGILTAMVPRAQPLRAAAPRDAEQPHVASAIVWWWLILLGWLLLAAMLVYLFYLMIEPCGLKTGRTWFCRQPAPEISAIPGERMVIEDEIAALQHELALLDRSCQPVIPVLPVTPAEPAAPPVPEDKTEAAPDELIRRFTERGGRQGNLNFVLGWSGRDDIDLSVTCPAGQTVSAANPGDCNGTLDLEANANAATAVTDPVENVVFVEVVPGLYKVTARLKDNRSNGEKPVTLHVMRKDGRSRSYSGTVSDKAPEWSLNISVSR